MLKLASLIVILSLSACGQTKPVAKKQAAQDTPQTIKEGAECLDSAGTLTAGYTYGSSINLRGDTVLYQGNKVWSAPDNQVWECLDKKWKRDLKAEATQAAHHKLVNQTRSQIATRKLNKDEISVIGEATDHVPYSGNCGTDGCDALFCSYAAIRSAELIAQLSFWKPTEEQLPLAMLQVYLKGMRCDNGTQRAYEIMNGRITSWLEEQVK